MLPIHQVLLRLAPLILTISGFLRSSSVHAQIGPDFHNDVASILKQWGAPGVAISVVKDGEVVFSGGFGTTKLVGGSPITGQTLTTVASVTKTVNAVAVAMLSDAGLLKWDDPVKKHIPEFHFADAYRTEHTTLRDLMTHRAGLPNVLGGSLWVMDYSIEQLLKDLPSQAPRIAFREKVDYSQVGIALVGEVVRRVSGRPWAEFVDSAIFRRLGMNSSHGSTRAFLAAHPDADRLRELMGRVAHREGKLTDIPWRGIGEVYTPAGGLITTADDMAKYMLFLLGGGIANGRHLLSNASIREMHTPNEIEGTPYTRVFNPLVEFAGYGLGWIAHEYSGRLVVEHPGSNFGSSVVALLPEEGLGIFISTPANYPLESDRMVSAIKFATFDYVLRLPRKDWKRIFGEAR